MLLLGAEIAMEAEKRIGCEVVQGYGMTELSPVSHTTSGNVQGGSSGSPSQIPKAASLTLTLGKIRRSVNAASCGFVARKS